MNIRMLTTASKAMLTDGGKDSHTYLEDIDTSLIFRTRLTSRLPMTLSNRFPFLDIHLSPSSHDLPDLGDTHECEREVVTRTVGDYFCRSECW